MLDNRIALDNGAILPLGGQEYLIRDTVGRGASCLAYIAECESNLFIIKEFYPADISTSIKRSGSDWQIEPSKTSMFCILRQRFTDSARDTVAFYGGDSNHSLPPASVYDVGNAVFSIVPLTQGGTLTHAKGLTVYEIAQIMISICNAIEKIHSQGKLYLDVKPDNVFLFKKEINETRRIALFDFDTVMTIANLANAAIPFSPGWSPYEQEYQKHSEILPASDIYSLGALFYWLISNNTVTSSILTDIENDEFSFLSNFDCLSGFNNALTKTKQIFSTTLRYSPTKRVQTTSELTKMFVELKDLTQPSTGALGDKIDEVLERLSIVHHTDKSVETGQTSNQTEHYEQVLSQTLQDADFDSVFTEVPHFESFGLADERTNLKMFHLNLNNNLFSYDALHEFLVENIGQYVFSRAKIDQLELSGKTRQIAYKALGQLRSATVGNTDNIADELGGILLYAFLEQVLKAPKLFSRVELANNSNPNIMGNSGIHLCTLGDDDGIPAYQMVFGKSRIEGNLEEAIDDAFSEIDSLYNNSPRGLQFVESTVFAQSFDKATAERLSSIIVPNKMSPVYMDKAFGVFLGYPFGLDGKQFSSTAFRAEMNKKMQDDIKAHVGYIAGKIKTAGMENCSFYIYTLPFNDADADKKTIMTALMEGR